MRIAMVGTRGVPARYGGFETAIEEIGSRLVARGHEVRVYCRGADDPRTSYLGMQLVHLPALRQKVAETPTHTTLSVAHLLAHPVDAVIMFNAANAPLLPVLRVAGMPVATHVDGLEWKRSKWGRLGRQYYLVNERLAVWWSDALIADAHGISDYYQQKFGAPTRYIPYGAPILRGLGTDKLRPLDAVPRRYHLVVARFEPENHVHVAVEGYRRSGAHWPLLVVGSAPYASEYIEQVRASAGGDPNVHFLGGIWDQDQLNQLYAHALTYVHGHSVGGTNPSLLRAMGAGAPVVAWDVNFNREVLGDTGRYFSDPESLACELAAAEANAAAATARGAAGQRRAAERYDWDDVTDGYEQLCEDLAAGRTGDDRRRSARKWQTAA